MSYVIKRASTCKIFLFNFSGIFIWFDIFLKTYPAVAAQFVLFLSIYYDSLLYYYDHLIIDI